MPRIFDCFTFFNENDVLAIRLEELAPVVDRFVIVHANKTFRGNDKPDYFDYERFLPYKEKIALYTLDFDKEYVLPDNPTPWDREITQRNSLLTVMAADGIATGEDTVILSDVDEIPRRSVVAPVDELKRLIMLKFSYGINMLTNEGNSSVKMFPYWMMWQNPAEWIRRQGEGTPIQNAGWEFSSLGYPEEVLYKLKNFSHSEFDNEDLTVENLAYRMYMGQDILGRDIVNTVVDIDDTWPEAIKNDRAYWEKYEW